MPAAPGRSLFAVVDSPSLSPDQARLLSYVEAEPTTAEVHLGVLVDSAVARLEVDSTVVFPVSPELSFAAIGGGVTRHAPDEIYWTGSMLGEVGQVNLLLQGDQVLGDLQARSEGGPTLTYSFRPLGNGLHALICIDPSKFLPD